MNAIEAARCEILINDYALTTGSGISGALINADGRGVDRGGQADGLQSPRGLSSLVKAVQRCWMG